MRPAAPNPAPAATPENASLPPNWLGAIERMAHPHPERTAIICGTRSISFGELSAWSDTIARQLLDAGIAPGDSVGSGFQRTAELIPALLGILKAGASYLPLDPAYPAARIVGMITSARIGTVLTTDSFSDAFPGVKTISVAPGPAPGQTHTIPDRPDAAVYAIFTSGSTGEPKAAAVRHSGFANLLKWYREDFALGPADRTLVISSPSFDLTQKNLFTPLITGGTLVLDERQTYDIPHILALIREHCITLVNCTPSAFYPLVDAAAASGFQDLASLRFAVLGGEPISIPRLRAWLENPACRAEVVNSYGPTECTDICLFHRLTRQNLDSFPIVPLGREIPNVQVSIRDESLARLPDGQTGELCITGAGLGTGYLHDPDRTADRFTNGLYRTGDLAKRHPCGTFEFRGRADHQVKVSGFRIELGEIEIALNRHPQVREAIVTATDGRLTAHVQGDAGSQALRDHLAALLPAHMVPAAFISIRCFPLTPNGKIDRNALITTAPAPAAARQPAGNDLETRILALWSEVLEHPVSDPTANFFDLGGTSILIAVVHVRLREMTGRDFPITDLFARPNVRAIASHLADSTTTGSTSAQDRARRARAGLARFKSPLPR